MPPSCAIAASKLTRGPQRRLLEDQAEHAAGQERRTLAALGVGLQPRRLVQQVREFVRRQVEQVRKCRMADLSG